MPNDISRFRNNGGFSDPDRYGYKTWTFEPSRISGNSGGASGRLAGVRVPVTIGVPITRVDFFIGAAGSGLGNITGGIYSLSGNLIVAGTMDAASVWQTVSVIAGFSVPSTLLTTDWYACVAFNGTTPPNLAHESNNVALATINPTDGFVRSLNGPANGATGTTPPSTIGTVTAVNRSWWCAAK